MVSSFSEIVDDRSVNDSLIPQLSINHRDNDSRVKASWD